MVKFKLNKAQRYYWRKRKRRNLILKARQKGISKVIDADQTVDCIRMPISAVVISHEKTSTQRLFASVRSFIESMQYRPVTSIDSKSEIRFPYANSSYFIGTAGQKAFGRGDTVARAHLSEAAFYPDLERILAGIEEAAEFGQIDVETTPNGRDAFYDRWQKAKAGMSSYTPIFIPWFIDGEYDVNNLSEKEKAGLSNTVRYMIAMPDDVFMAQLTDEERKFKERVDREWASEGVVITPGMLKWRRYKIWDKGQLFFQEYPEDDVSCFLQSGRTVFAAITTDQSKKIPLDNFDAWVADKKVKQAMLGRTLYAGVDGAEGTPTGDRHCFSVIDAPAGSDKAHVIFEITSNDPIDIFWQKVKVVNDKFNLRLGVEKNGVGVAHVQQARKLGIIVHEWTTSATNRPVMITELEEGYRKEELIESYPEAENEARDMEYDAQNRASHKTGKHDDRVFARSIAWQMRKVPSAGIEFV